MFYMASLQGTLRFREEMPIFPKLQISVLSMQGAKRGGVAYSKAMTKCKSEICLSEVKGFSLSFQLLYI